MKSRFSKGVIFTACFLELCLVVSGQWREWTANFGVGGIALALVAGALVGGLLNEAAERCFAWLRVRSDKKP